MASYYYLIASLPDLRSDGEMPISYEEFLAQCETSVSESTYKILKELTLSSDKGPLVKEWYVMYQNLMGELNYQRSVKLGKTYLAEYDKDPATSQVASAAMSARNPLEAEKILLDYEFENLDSLVGLHYFDDIYLFGYAIKLKLLERQECFVQAKGKEEFKRLFDQVQQRVYSL
jgi:hypothetical protein